MTAGGRQSARRRRTVDDLAQLVGSRGNASQRVRGASREGSAARSRLRERGRELICECSQAFPSAGVLEIPQQAVERLTVAMRGLTRARALLWTRLVSGAESPSREPSSQ